MFWQLTSEDVLMRTNESGLSTSQSLRVLRVFNSNPSTKYSRPSWSTEANTESDPTMHRGTRTTISTAAQRSSGSQSRSEMWWNLESCIFMSSNKQSFKTRTSFFFFLYIHIKNETIVIIMFISRWQSPKGKLKKNSFAFAEENISACLSSGILFYLSDFNF